MESAVSRWNRLLVLLLSLREVAAAEGGTCYPPGGVAGIVVATVVVTLVVVGLAEAMAWRFWWLPRQMQDGQNVRGRPESQQKGPSDFAFDNPYFRNNQEGDEVDGTTGRSRTSVNNNKNSLRSSKLSEASSKAKKARGGGKNHFGFGGGRKKTQDDSCIAAVEPERVLVTLRGKDFTGLGFNICGNMRDGILVKDVLHRGPASESGLIKAGDRIVNVTVSFTNIVYEDALTILSYASPYDVQLEIERLPSSTSSTASNAPKRLGSCSFNNSGQKLFHPLYRSQSIDDLTQIEGGGSNGGTFPSHGGGPRRSQSVGVAAHKLASHFKKEDKAGGPASLVLSTTGSLNEKMLANVMTDSRGMQWEKRFEDTLDSEPDDPPEDTVIKRAPSKSSYLDYPHSRLQMEMRAAATSSTTHHTEDRATKKATIENSRDHQGPREDSIQGKKGHVKKEEGNDSDVSKDSLEVTQRVFAKRNMKSVSNLEVKNADDNRPSERQIFLQKTMDKTKSAPNLEDRPSRTHNSSQSSSEDSNQDKSSSYRRDSADHTKPSSSKQSAVFSTRIYGEGKNFAADKIVVNGVEDDCNSGRQVSSQRGSEGRSQPKFAKKVAPTAGGMFTQINPFQISKQQRGQWTIGQTIGSDERLEFSGRSSGYTGPKLSLKEPVVKHRQF